MLSSNRGFDYLIKDLSLKNDLIDFYASLSSKPICFQSGIYIRNQKISDPNTTHEKTLNITPCQKKLISNWIVNSLDFISSETIIFIDSDIVDEKKLRERLNNKQKDGFIYINPPIILVSGSSYFQIS